MRHLRHHSLSTALPSSLDDATSDPFTPSRSPIPPFIHHIGVAADSHLKSEEKRDDDDGDDGGEEGGRPRRTEAETNPHS